MKENNEQIIFSCQQPLTTAIFSLVDTGRKLNVHKTFKRRHGYLLNVLCTFNLRPVSTGSDLLDLPNYLFFLSLEKSVWFKCQKYLRLRYCGTIFKTNYVCCKQFWNIYVNFMRTNKSESVYINPSVIYCNKLEWK